MEAVLVTRFRFSGLSDKDSTTAASTTLSIDISNLHRGMIYEIQAAERWKQNVEPHTLFSFPIEVRTGWSTRSSAVHEKV